MKRPILLWITSRSRSSLVSKIFINHGVWWGNTPVIINGYTSWENQDIKKLQKEFKTKYWKKIHCTPVSSEWNEEFLEKLHALVPSDQTWMMKTGIEYFNAFCDLNPYNIFIRRPAVDVANSLTSKRRDVVWQDAYNAALWRFNYMDQIQSLYGGVNIDTDEILKGNFVQVKEGVEYCGLDFNENHAHAAIVPKAEKSD